MTDDNTATDQPIRPVGSGLADSPEVLAMAAQGLAIPSPATAGTPTTPTQPETLSAPSAVPGAVPGVPGLSAPTPPPAAAPTPEQPAHTEYATAGRISANDLINGDPNQFTAYNPVIAQVRDEVQDILIQQGLDSDLADARYDRELQHRLTAEIDRLAMTQLLNVRVPNQAKPFIIASVVNEIVGLGPLEPLWQDPAITEVIVNGPNEVYAERYGLLVPVHGARFRSAEHLLDVCQRILFPLNRKLDVKTPLADGRLPDGSRVNAVHQAIAPQGPLLTIRRFPEVNRSLADLVDLGAMSEDMAALLAFLVKNRASSLVVGGTGSGKAIAVDCLVPTPNGFARMGDLDVGDTVFDEMGAPTDVVGAYDVQYGRPCYEVVFSDGSSVVVDAEHLWRTDTRSSRRAVGRARASDKMRARRSVLTSSQVARLKTLSQILPTDAAVCASDLSNFLGWETVTERGRWYSLTRELEPVGSRSARGRKGTPERLFLAAPLIESALERWSEPWHDQRHKREVASVRTTQQIKDSLRLPAGHANHSIPLMGSAAEYPERELTLHPRLLGLWLGDGDSRGDGFCSADPELGEAWLEHGFQLTQRAREQKVGDDPNFRVWGVPGLRAILRNLGLIQVTTAEGSQKRIPSEYLFSSEEQRRALLSGLLDTDGSVNRDTGAVEFYSSSETLARQVRTLVASLGYRPTLRQKTAHLDGRDMGLTYTVAFQGRGDEFGLERKTAVWRAARAKQGRQGERHNNRYIVDVREVPSVPVRCIRVANESHLFLVGETYIPTHNTTLLNALSAAIPLHERVITIEDSLELRLNPESHVAAMEARPADASGSNAVPIRQLVKNALRMRPDRIVVGEIRDQAALDMLQACNTGHEGSMSTVHANGPNEAMSRLAVMVAQGGEMPADKVDWLVGSALDLIIMIRRYKDGSRRVSGLYEVPEAEAGKQLLTIPLWEWRRTGESDDGVIEGEYVKVNDPSASLRERLGLDFEAPVTYEDVLVMSGRPAPQRQGEPNE